MKTFVDGSSSDVIRSRANPLISEASSLALKKYRDKTGCFIFEGKKLFGEALASGVEIVRVFVREDATGDYAKTVPRDKLTVVSETVYEKISTEKSPEGILTVAKHIDNLHKFVTIYNTEKNVGTRFMAVQLRDPGNLGTVIRDANALGIDELIISSDCADIYNPKTVRAAMGALFRQRITSVSDIISAVTALKASGYTVLAAALDRTAVRLTETKVGANTCFAIGNEGHGLERSFIENCSGSVFIPMRDGSESLNAAAAAAILIWETGKKSWIQ